MGDKIIVFDMYGKEVDIINELEGCFLQRVIGKINRMDLMKAVKGLDEETKETIFRNMTPRAVTMLKEDIEVLREVSLIDIQASKKKIIDTIIRLQDSGEIVIGRNWNYG